MASVSNTNAPDTDKKRASKKAATPAAKKRPARKTAAKKASEAKPRSKEPAAVNKPEKLAKGPVALDARLGIESIAALVNQLEPVLSAEGPITIDAAKVDSVDSAALQVLIAFANSARAQSRALEWQGATGALVEFSELADLGRYLEISAVPTMEEDDGLCPVF